MCSICIEDSQVMVGLYRQFRNSGEAIADRRGAGST